MTVLRLGTTEVTPAAAAALAAVNADATAFFHRHQRGDWGDVEERRRIYNDLAAQQDQIVLSVYTLKDGTEIIVTTAADRSSTVLLLATEYRREVSTQQGYTIWSTTYDSEKNSLIAVEAAHVDVLLAPLLFTTAL